MTAESWGGFRSEAVGDTPQGSNHAIRVDYHAGADGGVRLCALNVRNVLTYTPAEWTAFVAGAVVGKFSGLHAVPVT